MLAFAVLTTLARPAVADHAPSVTAGRKETRGVPDHVRRLARPHRGMKTAPAVTTDTLAVHYEDGSTAAERRSALAKHDADPISSIAALDVDVVEVEASERTRIASALRADPDVESVERESVRRMFEVPRDEIFDYQWNLKNARTPAAWDVTHGSSVLDIAVVDTGVDAAHPDLAGRVVAGYDFVNNDTDATDDNGHGTMVAGIAAAKTNNEIGIAGAAFNARIMPVKVLDETGSGVDGDIADGIVWAADHGAEVINLSLGGTDASDLLSDAIDYAVARGSVVVAASGNEGSAIPSYPAALGNVIAVGATDIDGNVVWFSNRGPHLDVVAQGWDVISTDLSDAPDPYAVGAGTSFAAPLVSGIAALVRAKMPSLTPAQVGVRIRGSGIDRGPTGFDDAYGFGMVDAYAAVGGRKTPHPPLPPSDDNDSPAWADGTSTSDWILPEGDIDWYAVNADRPGRIDFTVTPDDLDDDGSWPFSLDLVVTAYDPDLNRIDVFDEQGSGDWERFVVSAPRAGTYLFKVENALTSVGGMYSVNGGHSYDAFDRMPTVTRYDTSDNATGVEAADLTGDGLTDVVMATENDGTLTLYAQLLDGTLERRPIDTTIDDWSTDVALADLDLDGDLDVAFSHYSGIDLYTQNNGAITKTTSIPATKAPSTLAVADVSGDPRPELVTGAWDKIYVYEQGPDGWTEREAGRGSGDWDVAVGDVTGDGRADILNATGWLHMLEQQPDGSFAHRVVTEGSRIRSVEIADVNEDERLDVVYADDIAHVVGVMVQTAGGELAPAVEYASQYPLSVRIGDMNGDGHLDVVTTHTRSMQVRRGDGNGVFDAATTYYSPDTNPSGEELAIGHLDDDTTTDVAIANTYLGLVTLTGLATDPPPGRHWIRSVTPRDGRDTVETTVSPVVAFARALDPTSITASTVTLIDGATSAAVLATRTWNAMSRTITIDPSQWLRPGAPYIVEINGVRDTVGNTSDRSTSRFVTRAAAAPSVDLRADFDGNGRDDVAAGAPGEDFGSFTDAGAVTVLYSGISGPVETTQVFTQDTAKVPGAAESGDRFGSALATGDFNADGFDDLAIGVIGEDLGSVRDAGLVHVVLGSVSGLKAGGQIWTQESSGVQDFAEAGDAFGTALATGRFDNVAGEDLAIGVPRESVGTKASAGIVHILRGASEGLTTFGAQLWTQDNPLIARDAAAGDAFGIALGAGDLEGDGNDDLLVGATGDQVGDADAGSVQLFKGSIVGLRPSEHYIDERTAESEASLDGERFGASVAIGDIGGLAGPDGYADIVIGVPGQMFNDKPASGAVRVLYSDWTSFAIWGTSVYDFTGIGGVNERFGTSVAVRRTRALGVNAPGLLAIGAPGDDVGSVTDAGSVTYVNELVGHVGLADLVGRFTRAIPQLGSVAQAGEAIGTAIRLLDVDGNGVHDLVVGAPVNSAASQSAAGAVIVVRGAQNLTSAKLYVQGSGGVPGGAEARDLFGYAIGG